MSPLSWDSLYLQNTHTNWKPLGYSGHAIRTHLHSEKEDLDYATPHTYRATLTFDLNAPLPLFPRSCTPHRRADALFPSGGRLDICSERRQPSTVRRTSQNKLTLAQCRGGFFSQLLPQTNLLKIHERGESMH